MIYCHRLTSKQQYFQKIVVCCVVCVHVSCNLILFGKLHIYLHYVRIPISYLLLLFPVIERELPRNVPNSQINPNETKLHENMQLLILLLFIYS